MENNHELPKEGFKGIIAHWRSDFLAAISVSLVALPLGLGVAVASGAPPISGLISAIVGGIVATLFRGSHLAINGPAAGLIAVILAAIYSLDDGTGQTLNYVLAAITIAGIIQVALGFLKLGKIAEILPSSVIQGIMVAIGIIIFASQIHVAMGTSPTGRNTIELLKEIFYLIPDIHPIIFLLAIIGIALQIFIPKIQSRVLHFFPASLWVLIVSVALAYAFNFFDSHNIELFGKSYHLGPDFLIKIPDDLRDAIIFPNYSRIADYRFWLAVISITLIASIQTLAMAKAVDKLDPYKRKSDLNKDLIGVGMATAISGAIGGLPIITVIVRSTVNINNHAKTKWSNFYHGVLIIIFLFVLTPVIQMIPLAALASILVYIGYRLASPTVFKKIYSMGMEQLIFMLTTIAITLYSDLLMGILFGSLFTLLVHALLSRMPAQDFFKALFQSDTKLNEHDKNNYELDMRGIANFLSIPKVEKLLSVVPSTASVSINLNNTRLVGTTFMEFIVEFLRSHEEKGGRVTISGLEDHVSSSTHNRALKISLTNREVKLSPRQKKLTDFAKTNGYQFVSNVDWNTSYLRNFHFFETRPIERKDNCLRGKFEELDMDWEIADVTFNEGAAFTAEIFHATVMTLKIDREMPKFTMEKEGVLDKLFDRVMALSGYKDIDFEMYTHFSKKFLIMGENESAIRSFFTHDLISFFEGEQVFHIESNGEALLIFNKLKLTRTDETLNIMNFAKKLAKRIKQ